MILKNIKRMNSRVDTSLAPERPNPLNLYRNIISEIDFDRALHLGSGRDKHGIGTEIEAYGDVVAFDPDIEGIRRNSAENRVIGDGQRLPFQKDSFDLVFSEYVFEHLPDPKSALEEINRVTRRRGSFVVLVPNPRHYYAIIADFTPFWFHKFWKKLQGGENIEKDTFPTQYKWGSYSDIRRIDFEWEIEEFQSFPGPTGYTKILPIHILFVLFARTMADYPKYHVKYVCHYTIDT